MSLNTDELFAGQELVDEGTDRFDSPGDQVDAARDSGFDEMLDNAFSRNPEPEGDEQAEWQEAINRKYNSQPDAPEQPQQPVHQGPTPEQIRMQQLEAAVRQQQAIMQQAQQFYEEQNAPRWEDDPQAYFNYKEQQFAQQQQAMAQQVQQLQQREEIRQLHSHVQVEEARFAQQHPDYVQAADYVFKQEAAQLRSAYPQASDAQIQAEISRRVHQDAAAARAQGRSPAEYLYQLAQRIGYKAQPNRPRPKATTTLATTHGSARDASYQGTSFAGLKASDINNLSAAEFDAAWCEMERGGTVMPKV